MPEISIIIPIYNVESYLEKCIETVINQTIKDIEIILVNDGSTDNSGYICDIFAKKDSRIKVIHKSNEGVSKARNDGLDIAKGRYIGFVDGDDFIDLDMFETLYEDIVSNDADMSICCLRHYYEKNDKGKQTGVIYKKKKCNCEEAIYMGLKEKNVGLFLWNKLFKREVIGAQRLPEHYAVAEDTFFVIQYLLKVDKIIINEAPKYYYRQRLNSCTKSEFSNKDLHTVKVFDEIYKQLSGTYPGLEEIIMHYNIKSRMYAIDKIMATSNFYKNENLIKLVSFLRKNFFRIIIDKEFRLKRKITITMLLCSSRLYHYFYKKVALKKIYRKIEMD